MERLSHNHSDNSNELLSAYIDNAVDAVERRRAERYIDACAACAQEVQELRLFRELLRDLPNVQPRRSFTLDPATVAPPRRLLFPTFRWASLVAAALFLVVVGVDALGVGRNPATLGFSTAAAPAAQAPDQKGSPELSDSSATGGAAETLRLPAASPAASAAMGQSTADTPGAPLPAEGAATAGAANRETIVASDAMPEAVTGAYPPPQPLASPLSQSPAPAMAGGAPTSATADDAADGAAGQSGFRMSEPAGGETANITPDAAAQSSWWSSYTLRIAEVVLGIIVLLLGGAALWTWRRQV